jgi:hypothetical protein
MKKSGMITTISTLARQRFISLNRQQSACSASVCSACSDVNNFVKNSKQTADPVPKGLPYMEVKFALLWVLLVFK